MSDLAERYDRVESRVKAWRPSTWLLGLVVTIFGWSVTFALPSPGLDVSWWGGLFMATHEGLQFGTEVVFTYGPLGFMKMPFLWFDGLASIAFVYAVGIAFAFSCALIWTLRSRVGAPLACLITFFAMGLLPIDPAIGLAVLWGFAILSERPPRRGMTVLITAGAVFAAAEALMKLSSGPVIVLVLLIALIGSRASLRQVATFLGTFVVSFLALWLITGQDIGNIPDFATNSIQIILGYNEAMATYGQSNWLVLLMILGTLLTVGWTWFGGIYRDHRARIAGTAIAIVVGAAMYKQGVVRMDSSHVGICFAGLAVIWAAVPAVPRWNYVLYFGLAGIAVASIHVYPPPGGGQNFDVFGNLASAKREVRTLVSPSRKQDLIDQRRFVMQAFYDVKPAVLDELKGHRVSVDPWEIGVTWAYELDWSPLPVFQNYSAYTTHLDELNTEEVESPEGPDRILKNALAFGGIDGRNLNWDPPGQAIATLCNFRPVATEGIWQALARVPDRCGPETPAGEVDSAFGETVEVPAPAPDEVIFVKVEGTEARGLEKLKGLLYKLPERRATLSDGSTYRVVPSIADDGLLLRSGKKVGDDDAFFSQVPDTETIKIDGGGGELKYDFYRMKVAPAAGSSQNAR